MINESLESQRDPSFLHGFLIPWIICLLAAVFYFYDFVLRVTPSVMIHQLMSDYHVNAFQIGLLSAFYYYIYTPLQFPSGAVVDKYSRRLVLTASIFVCAIGGFVFASTDNFYVACFARLLMGLGSAFAFVGAMKLASMWLPFKQYALYSGIITAFGTLGAITTDIALSHSIQILGWRETIYVTSYAGVGLGIIMLLVIRDKPKWVAHASSEYKSWRSIGLRLWHMLLNWRIWINGIVGAALFLPINVFASLWGVDFLSRAYQLSVTQAAFATSLIFWGATVGFSVIGAISDAIKSRRIPLFIGTAVTLGLTSVLIYMNNLPYWVVYLILFAIGMFVSPQALVFAVAREISPPRSTGLSSATTNFIVTIGAAILQPLIGYLLDANWQGKLTIYATKLFSVENYRSAFFVLIIALSVSFLLTFLIPSTKCQKFIPGA